MSIKSNKGVTLVELMVSIAIFGIIASAAMGLLLYATNVNSDVTADVVEASRVYQVLDFVKETVAQSSQVQPIDNDNESGVMIDSTRYFNWKKGTKEFVFKNLANETVLLENITHFEAEKFDSAPEKKVVTLRLTTASGNTYELTVACKNG